MPTLLISGQMIRGIRGWSWGVTVGRGGGVGEEREMKRGKKMSDWGWMVM